MTQTNTGRSFQRKHHRSCGCHKDRFTRFRYDLFEWIFEQHQAVLICDNKDNKEPTKELTDDLMSIITVHCQILRKRKYKNELQYCRKIRFYPTAKFKILAEK